MQLKWHRTIYTYCKEVINTHTTLINNRVKCNLMSEQKNKTIFDIGLLALHLKRA